ncbi:universal stress protein [Lactobacillus sp. ESL0701]|uniref:universal stress protein n=1 Tax=unclassified Lactobacillus TaxID=2620435 RepID=UPI0023F79D8F|nr:MULTISPECIES: universal stress protein [unclassified Lactobacillus]MDF7668719.1 universal stress protein [Lactobacillus sp. ESL0703]MDF7671797.1 universal stress protein [Lactobacillus sp. ESL0701]WEV38590.1 universal stress protein [Lactobacillus sp. ESL0680]
MSTKKDSILVPVDGSESAERSFDKAVKIALTENAHIDILNVIDTRQFLGEMQDTLISGDTVYQMTQDTSKYLKSLKQWAHDNFDFDDIDYHIRYGSPKAVISYDFIKDHHDNLIIMGATGLNAVERMLMGSVTEYVNQHALADVLIVRTDVDNNPIRQK